MKKITALVVFTLAGLSLSFPVWAGIWGSFPSKYKFKPKTTPQLRLQPGACSNNSECRSGSPYCWGGSCRSCTHPTVTEPLRNTGYVRCDEGFCTNSGAAAFAAIFGGAGEFQTIDCGAVPPPPARETPQATRFGLGRDDYTIGTVAIPYEGQQLGTLQCDPGEVAVRVTARADTIVRSVTGLDCKPINGLPLTATHSKTPPSPLGNPGGTEATAMAPNGSALVGFEARWANTNEYDNRVANLKVLSPVRLNAATGVEANESTDPGEDAGVSTFGTFNATNSPWVRSMCPDKQVMTGVWVVYDSDSVKSVTPTCKRVFAPGEAPSSVADGVSGLGKGSEVGYLGGRVVSNAGVAGNPFGSEDTLCPEGSVMTGWLTSQHYYGQIDSVPRIYCQDINSISGDCTADSPRLASPAETVNLNLRNYSLHTDFNDFGLQGCAMVGFEYKLRKLRNVVYAEQPPDSQVFAELHSILANRDQTQSGVQGHNVGRGPNGVDCGQAFYNCNTSDWIPVRCPAGSFMVGVKGLAAGQSVTSLAAYCREAVEGPWTEATEPAPGSIFTNTRPGVLTTPIRLQPLSPAP